MSKPSRPARLYLQVTNNAHLDPLSEKVRSATFTDARNTASDPVLLGPPNLEFAPYQRAATGKRRNDARQGTIDQDPEFMEFLESLISPISKPAQAEASDDKTAGKVTVTPLIQHLRDKKAAKEAAKQKKDKEKTPKQANTNAKEAVEKKADGETAANSAKETVSTAAKKNGRGPKADKVVKATPTKVVKKENPSVEAKPAPKPQVTQATTTPTTSGTAPTAAVTQNTQVPARKADTVNPAAAAARMLQRDLGMRGGRGGSIGRRGGRQVQDTTLATTPAVSSSPQNTSNPAKPIAAQNVATQRPTVPASQPTPSKPSNTSAVLQRTPAQATTTIPAPPLPPTTKTLLQSAPPPPKSVPLPLSGHGFLKHANPSQGITEPLLEVALGVFGTIVKVEIDKRKGFAYVEYTESVGLQKAIAASPIKVAQGSVQVLEKRDRVGRGAPGQGQGGMQVQGQAQVGRGAPGGMMGRGPVAGQVPTGPAAYRAGRDGGSVRGRGQVPPMQGVQKVGGTVSAAPIQAPAPTAAIAPTALAAAGPPTASAAMPASTESTTVTATPSAPPAQPASTTATTASSTPAAAPATVSAPDTTSAPPPAAVPAE